MRLIILNFPVSGMLAVILLLQVSINIAIGHFPLNLNMEFA